MTAPMLHNEPERFEKLEFEEMPDGRWKISKIHVSIYNKPKEALKVIENYIKYKEENENEKFR